MLIRVPRLYQLWRFYVINPFPHCIPNMRGTVRYPPLSCTRSSLFCVPFAVFLILAAFWWLMYPSVHPFLPSFPNFLLGPVCCGCRGIEMSRAGWTKNYIIIVAAIVLSRRPLRFWSEVFVALQKSFQNRSLSIETAIRWIFQLDLTSGESTWCRVRTCALCWNH